MAVAATPFLTTAAAAAAAVFLLFVVDGVVAGRGQGASDGRETMGNEQSKQSTSEGGREGGSAHE